MYRHVRGLDIFKLKPSEFLSENEIEAAALVQTNELNVQMQQKYAWPANLVVAKAYIDQLNRSKAIPLDQAHAVTDVLGRADKIRSAGEQADIGVEPRSRRIVIAACHMNIAADLVAFAPHNQAALGVNFVTD